MIEEPNTSFKIFILGYSGVGKVCILYRYVENIFLKKHLDTIGLNFKAKTININNQEIKLKIYETAGQEKCRKISKQYYKDADGIVLVYDVTKENTFDKIKEWAEQILPDSKEDKIGLILLGNKCDMEERMVSEEQGKELAEEFGINYFETSALTGQGINEAFEQLTKDIIIIKGLGGDYKERLELKKNKKKKRKNGDNCSN